MKSQIMRLTNVSSSTSAYILQALLAAQEKDRIEELLEGEQAKVNYELNPADVIDEEDLEESAGDLTLRQLSQTVKKVESKKKLATLGELKAGKQDSQPSEKSK